MIKAFDKTIKLGRLVIVIRIGLDSARKAFSIAFEVFWVRELIDELEYYLEEEAKQRSEAER